MTNQTDTEKDTSETDRKSSIKVLTWNSCYDDSWNGLIVPEAFSHPAKFAPGLIRRIYQHCLAQGYLRKGDTVVDPFGGIGSGGIFAAPMGLKWVGCELEARFAGLAGQNFAVHESAWLTMGYPLPVICTGDSRRLSEIIGQADLVATSPPYADQFTQQGAGIYARGEHTKCKQGNVMDYGTTPGQIDSMKAGSVDAVCTSPPFTEDQPCASQSRGLRDYHAFTRGQGTKRHYNEDPSNIGNLRAGDVGAVVTSPPYAGIRSDGGTTGIRDGGFTPYTEEEGNAWHTTRDPRNIGNLGDETTVNRETYWQAVSQVYAECHKILKPSGVLVVVVKAYIKNKRRVPLPQQTLKLLIHLGFTPLERIKAMLVKEEVTDGLFGEIRKTKERKSFFRRLAEKKGSPKIDWEEVLICRKGGTP